MSNANSIWSFSGPSAGIGNAITTASAFTYPVGGAIVVARLPANGEYKNKWLRIKAAARIQPGTSGNVTMTILALGETIATGTIMASTGAVSCASNCSAIMDVNFMWNNDTDTLLGYQTSLMGATPTLLAAAINTANIASNPDPTVATSLPFIVGCLFGTSNASNTAFLEEFSIDIV